jgi:osmoprotectant transport system permease protein
MYDALQSGRVDAITAFSSDGRIAADGLTLLSDPKGAVPSYAAMLLVSRDHAKDARFLDALKPLAGAIPVPLMREANYRVDRTRDKQNPDQASAWLESRIRK